VLFRVQFHPNHLIGFLGQLHGFFDAVKAYQFRIEHIRVQQRPRIRELSRMIIGHGRSKKVGQTRRQFMDIDTIRFPV